MSLASDYDALLEGAGAVVLARDVLRVSGPEAAGYLQGQLSQDVEALAPGTSALSLILEPQGKVDALVRVTRRADDEYLLDVEEGYGEAVAARLARFKLRTKVTVEGLAGWRCLAVRGPGAAGALGPPGTDDAGGVRAGFGWPGLEGVDLLGPDPRTPPGVPLCDPAAYEARRIETGLPAMGRELDEGTIPEEAGVVAAAVSFTKGCYTGQELVARIDSRGGNVPRRLRGLLSAGTVPAGARLWVGDREVGRVTSAALSPRLGAVGLAYVKRGFDPPADAEARWEEADQPRSETVEIRALPLDPGPGGS